MQICKKPGPKPQILSPQQKEVLLFIYHFSKQHGYCPSYNEIREKIGLKKTSISAIPPIIKALEKKGFLQKEARKMRSFTLLEKGLKEIRKISNSNIYWKQGNLTENEILAHSSTLFLAKPHHPSEQHLSVFSITKPDPFFHRFLLCPIDQDGNKIPWKEKNKK